MKGPEVDVYWHLRKKLFSVRSRKTRRVLRHTNGMVLRDVTFVVSEAGRQRAIRTGQRNVHAYVRGTISYTERYSLTPDWVELRYNPFRAPGFTDADGNIHTAAPLAVLVGGEVYIPPTKEPTHGQ